jgi:hypothetical protein
MDSRFRGNDGVKVRRHASRRVVGSVARRLAFGGQRVSLEHAGGGFTNYVGAVVEAGDDSAVDFRSLARARRRSRRIGSVGHELRSPVVQTRFGGGIHPKSNAARCAARSGDYRRVVAGVNLENADARRGFLRLFLDRMTEARVDLSASPRRAKTTGLTLQERRR